MVIILSKNDRKQALMPYKAHLKVGYASMEKKGNPTLQIYCEGKWNLIYEIYEVWFLKI